MDLRHEQTSCWSNINILLATYLPFDSGVRQRSHPLMIPLQCLRTKSNNRKRGQFECEVAWFCFCFDFVWSNARCGCYSIVCWRGWGFFWGGDLEKLDAQDQGGRNILDVDEQGVGDLEKQFSRTSYVHLP